MGLAGLGRCPSQCKGSKLRLGDLSKQTALFKSMYGSILRFGTLVLWYLTFVGHTQSKISDLKLVSRYMVGHIELFLRHSLKVWANGAFLYCFKASRKSAMFCCEAML